MRRAAVAWLFLSAAWTASADPVICDGTGIRVTADSVALAERICGVADSTVEWLAGCGLPLSAPVDVAVVEDLPAPCVGLYHCGADLVEVLDPRSLAEHRGFETRFATIPTDAYFDSLVAHEIAHAAMDDVPCPFGTCEVTQEYVAYVAQAEALPEAALAAFLGTADVGPARRDDLSRILLKVAPDRFAAKAIVHFHARADGCAYLGAIGRGDIILDRERP